MQEQKNTTKNLNDINRQDEMTGKNTPVQNPFHLSVVTEAMTMTLHDHFDVEQHHP